MGGETLRNCPFCGGRPERVTITDADEVANIGGDVITCLSCGASSQVQFGEKETLNEAWNRRSPDPELVEALDLVRQFHDQCVKQDIKFGPLIADAEALLSRIRGGGDA